MQRPRAERESPLRSERAAGQAAADAGDAGGGGATPHPQLLMLARRCPEFSNTYRIQTQTEVCLVGKHGAWRYRDAHLEAYVSIHQAYADVCL